jgi:hypothetical protein
MIFGFSFMLIFVGIFFAGFMTLMPNELFVAMPALLKMALFFVGILIAFIGWFMPWVRATKTGAIHLIESASPKTLIWFYVFRDGTVKITTSIREVEGQLYSKELDAQINDLKSYRLFDHSIRFVPEGIGHAVDLDMILYATLLKTKWGYANLREARDAGFSLFGYPKDKPIKSSEYVASGDQLETI